MVKECKRFGGVFFLTKKWDTCILIELSKIMEIYFRSIYWHITKLWQDSWKLISNTLQLEGLEDIIKIIDFLFSNSWEIWQITTSSTVWRDILRKNTQTTKAQMDEGAELDVFFFLWQKSQAFFFCLFGWLFGGVFLGWAIRNNIKTTSNNMVPKQTGWWVNEV